MRARGNVRPTSLINRSRFAIVSAAHEQPVRRGVSPGESGYGLCAYASRVAPAAPMRRRKERADMPACPPRGAVTPPATRARGDADLMPRYAGLRILDTYVSGETGLSQVALFGSFQTTQ